MGVRAAGQSVLRICILVAGLVAAIGARLVIAQCGLWINVSPSIPIGLYRSESLRSIRHGAFVLVCLPDSLARFGRERGYLRRGECPGDASPVGKRVLALAGDTVCIDGEGIALNGVPIPGSAMLGIDWRGRPLPSLRRGRYLVAARMAWLLATYSSRSWDSRYYGAIPVASIRSALQPIWTFSGID